LILAEKDTNHTFRYRQRPSKIVLDPEYDVFRLLHQEERPASLGQLFGAREQLLVIPENVDKDQLEAWQQLAHSWSAKYRNVRLVSAADTDSLPETAAVWLLGWQNELLQKYQQRFESMTQQLSPQAATVNNQRLVPDLHTVVLLDPDNTRAPLGFIGADNPQAIAMMAKKLPHYSSYGVLAFEKDPGTNIIKQYLPVINSPMRRQLAQ
jgi:hypothetical protein